MIIKNVFTNKQSALEPLARLAQPVNQLYYLGDGFLDLLEKPLVAIVGSRKVSPYGRAVTEQIAGELAKAGVVVVSGLAFGVDSIAHQAAVNAGGQTIAVLPGAIDNIYPASHAGLARQLLLRGGALVSEYAPGSGLPMKHQFIARNRIISGLSQAVLITEAAAKSGSLHTAEFGLEQGIEVMAVPGNITSPTSQGTNNLIKTGAAVITCADDILEMLKITPQLTPRRRLSNANSPEEQIVLDLLQNSATDITELQSGSGLDPSTFGQTISLLEIQGAIKINSGLVHII